MCNGTVQRAMVHYRDLKMYKRPETVQSKENWVFQYIKGN